MTHRYPRGTPAWPWPDTVPLLRRKPRRPWRRLTGAALACLALAALAAAQGCAGSGDATEGQQEPGTGILVDHYLTRDGKHRVCLYSGGAVITVRSLELCPLTD